MLSTILNLDPIEKALRHREDVIYLSIEQAAACAVIFKIYPYYMLLILYYTM